MHSTRSVAVLAAGLSLVLLGGTARAEGRVPIALLPMVVHSAEVGDYVRGGLADMLSSRLERIPDFHVIRIDDEAAATTKLDKALRTAAEAGAEFVLFGSFTRFGTGASLDVHCAAVKTREGESPLREIFVHSGNIGDVIPDLDDLVGKVARFVVKDYTERVADSGQPADLPSTRALNSLESRVTALEEAIRALTEAKAADLAGGPAASE
jgi:TolB-like protein